jgi:hypothetical protein
MSASMQDCPQENIAGCSSDGIDGIDGTDGTDDESSDQSSSSSDSSSSDSSSSDSSISSSSNDHASDHFGVPPDSEYAQQVQKWTIHIPIGLGLCPWAGKSYNRKCLRFVTCHGKHPSDVSHFVGSEIELLTKTKIEPLSSTLIVCPEVAIWKDFQVFEDYVTSGIYGDLENSEMAEGRITFVAFHPEFLRWRGLPKGLQVGSTVQSYWGFIGSKSTETAPATILETESKAFGKKKVKIRFGNTIEGCRQDQFVPIDWIDHTDSGPPLPNNFMHRSPYPTIHLISNKDLASFSIRTISRVKRKNAQRMMDLGWEGLAKRMANYEH